MSLLLGSQDSSLYCSSADKLNILSCRATDRWHNAGKSLSLSFYLFLQIIYTHCSFSLLFFPCSFFVFLSFTVCLPSLFNFTLFALALHTQFLSPRLSPLPYSGKFSLVQNFTELLPSPLEENFMVFNFMQCSVRPHPPIVYNKFRSKILWLLFHGGRAIHENREVLHLVTVQKFPAIRYLFNLTIPFHTN